MAEISNSLSNIVEHFLLPWDEALIGNGCYTKQSGYHKAVEIKASSIPEAGRGMFAVEDIQKGECIRSVPLISYNDEKQQYPFEEQSFPFIELGHIIKIPSKEALLSLISFFEEKSSSTFDLNLLRDFIATYQVAKVNNQEGLADELGCDQFLHLGYPPMCINHQRGEAGNVRIVYNVDTQQYEYIANSTIESGQELFFDYEKFQSGTNMLLAPWYLEWQKQNNVTSIVKLVVEQ